MSTTHEFKIESLPEKANSAEKPSLLRSFGTQVLSSFWAVTEGAKNTLLSPEARGLAKTIGSMALSASHTIVSSIRRRADMQEAGILGSALDHHFEVMEQFTKDAHFILSSDHALQAIRTKVLEYWEIPYHMRAEVMRSKFVDLPATKSKSFDSVHQHAVSAHARSNGSSTAERLAKVLGLKPIFYQRSVADERKGRAGSRIWYWHRDTTVSFEPHVVVDGRDLLCLIDVDYYVDMPLFLNTHFCPVFLYTFAPKQVARIAGDYSYWFDPSGQVQYAVSGGERYTHHVWNYSYSSLTVTTKFCGFICRVSTYLVERKHVDADHETILLIPVKRWDGLSASFASLWLEGNPLQRLNVVNGEFAQLRTIGLKGDNLSIGKLGLQIEASVPSVDVQGLEILAHTSKYPLTLPQILKHVDNNATKGTLLLQYVTRDVKEKPPIVFPPTEAVRRYQANVLAYDPEAKPGLRSFMSPIVHEAFAPDSCVGSDMQAVDGRLTKVRPPELILTQTMDECMDDFIKLFAHDFERSLCPVEPYVVYERQERPTQRALLHRAANLESKDSTGPVKSFVKKEAYSKLSDPRIISTLETPVKRDYSRYMYALETVFKKASWYAFGRQPQDIALRVADVARNADTLCNTDFSRFDGHGSNVMRELEMRLLAFVFKAEYHEEIMRLHRQQYGLRAVTYHGVWYETGYSRLSGSPETSLFNSLVNAFIAFAALRRTRVHGVPLSPPEAYSKLGIYGGDDGLTPDVDPKVYQEVAESFGQELAIEPVLRGELGIKFLARMYGPYVWFGDANSCCDIKRQIGKIHTTVVMPPTITATEKLLEKVRAFSLTDAHTPVLGDIVTTTMALYYKENKAPLTKNYRIAAYQSHWMDADEGCQYPNEAADWMMEVLQQQLPSFDYKRFIAHMAVLRDHGKLEDMLRLPVFTMPSDPVESKFNVVFEDRVLGPKSLEVPSGKPDRLPVRPRDALPIPERKRAHPEPDLPSSTDASSASKKKGQETFEACKARKVAAGTWKERTTKPAPRPRPNSGATKSHWHPTGRQAT